MNIFKLFSDNDDKQDQNFVYDQAVMLDIDLEGFHEFGSEEKQSDIQLLEKAITSKLPAMSGVDGHEFGEGTATVYIYGPSADSIFEAIETILKKSDFKKIDVTLQYGAPDDPAAKEKKFTL
jgi:hypothetical protein